MLSLITATLLLAPQDHASLHPAQAELYFEIPDVPALATEYRRTAYARLLRDEDLQRAIGAVLGQDRFDPWAELMALMDEAEASGELPPLRAMLADLVSVSGSVDTHESLMELGERLDAGDADGLLEHLAVQLVLDFGHAETARQVRDLVRDQAAMVGIAWDPTDGVEAAADGPDVLLARGMGSDADSFALVLDGARLSVGVGGPALDHLLGAAGEGAGTAVDGFAAGREAFSEPAGATLFELRNDLSRELQPLLEEEPAVLPLLDLAEGLLGSEVAMVARGGHWRVQLRDGMYVTEGLHPAPTHPLANLFASRPLADGALALVHPESVVAWAVHFDRERAIELLHREASEEELGYVAEQYGFDIGRDLLAPLGPALTWSMPGNVSLMAAPPLQMSVALEDPQAFRKGAEGLFRMLAAEGGQDFAVSSRDYRGYDIHTLRLQNLDLGLDDLPIDPVAMFQPSLVVLEDRAVLGLSPSHIKKEIRRVLKGGDDEVSAFAGKDIPDGVTEVGYADWIQVYGNLYSGLKGLVPLFASQAGGEIPFDLAALPEAEVFTRYFRPSMRWKRRTPQGVLHYSESSFGPEVVLLGSLGATAALFTVREEATLEAVEIQAVPVPADPAVPAGGPVAETRTILDEVRVALSVYRLDQGGYPAALKDLETRTDSYPSGYLTGSLVDAWGNDLRYERTETGCRLWSVGADGVDQDGLGDDLLSR